MQNIFKTEDSICFKKKTIFMKLLHLIIVFDYSSFNMPEICLNISSLSKLSAVSNNFNSNSQYLTDVVKRQVLIGIMLS